MNKNLQNSKKGLLSTSLGAFFFAIILWLFVISEKNYSYVFEMPIEVRNIREGKTLGGEVSPTADVRFRATGRELLKALLLKSISDFKLVLDLERVNTNYDFYLNDYFEKYNQKVVIPNSFNIEYVEIIRPESIQISLDDYMVKMVKVKPLISVEVSPGYTIVGKFNILPELLEFKGPKEIIENLDFIETISKKFKSVKAPINAKVPVSFNFTRVIESSDSLITFQANIQSIGERILSEIPVKILNIPDNIQAFPNPSTVSLNISGGVEFIASLQPTDIDVYIDYNDFTKNEISNEPRIQVPNDVIEWRDLSPKFIELTIRRLPE
tara:strand:+ start:11171 stop:12145 length:975 start_codon:yes stop_codon:yes gene_type:complete